MADNNYKEGNKASAFFERSNNLANASNVLKLLVDPQYCEKLYIIGDFVVSGGGAQLQFTASGATAGYDLAFINLTVIDESGNDAGGVATGTSAVVTVDTSGLNPSDSWAVKIKLSTEQDIALQCNCTKKAQIEIPLPSGNPTIAVNELTLGAQVLTVYRADGTTVIADGGAAYSLGTSIPTSATPFAFSIVLENTGKKVLKVTTPLGITADVLTAVVPAFGDYLFEGDTTTVTGTVDVSTTGAKTGAVTIASDDPANPSYVVNISYTVV